MKELRGTINKNTPVPLHYQLREIILAHIKDGRFAAGDCIPTEFMISDMFHISRNTVRQAISDLVKDGYLYRIKSKGTFVAKPKVELNYMTAIEPFNEQVRKNGRHPKTKVLASDIISADPGIASELKIQPGLKVIKILRVRYIDNEPIVIVESYHPYHLCASIMDYNLEKASLYEVLSKKEETKIAYVERTVEAIAAHKYESSILNIDEGFPLQSFINHAYTKDDTVVEYCLSKYRGDRNKFTIKIFR